MMKTSTISLGGESFSVTMMGLGQLRQALPIILSIRLDNLPGEFGKVIDVVKIALAVDYPDTDVDKIKATMMEVGLALEVIMDVNGFERKAPKPGEAPARVKKSTSRKSTAA